MAIQLTSTDINKKYYLKKHEKAMQIKLHVPNLYLWVTKNGKCTFRFKIYMKTVFTWVTLGNHPVLTVSDAVAKAHEMQSKRDAGVNPNEEKRELANKNILLADFVNSYIEVGAKINNQANSTTQSNHYLFNIIKDKLGIYSIQEITSTLIHSKLLKDYIIANKLAMANRFKIKLRQLFEYAIKRELIIKNPTSNLDTYYQPKDAHQRNLHLTEAELKEFINGLYIADIPNTVKYYIHLIIILGVRKSELANATWDMVDFNNAVFNNYQIKTKKENKLPLSEQAVKLLKRLRAISKDGYIMVNRDSIGKNKPVSHSYLNRVLDSLEFNKLRNRENRVSPHDFRRVLSTLANKSELFAPIDIEMALGHETRSSVERHYNNNATYLNRKRAVLDWTAKEVDKLIAPEFDVYNLLVV